MKIQYNYLVETVGPMADSPDVEGDSVGLLRRRGDGEGVPLKVGNARDVQEDVVARLEVKVRRPFDHQINNLHVYKFNMTTINIIYI